MFNVQYVLVYRFNIRVAAALDNYAQTPAQPELTATRDLLCASGVFCKIDEPEPNCKS